MAKRATFVFDKDFDDNLTHWRGSLNPIGDKFRSTADRIKRKAEGIAAQEANDALSAQMSLSGSRFSKSSRTRYKKAKAMAYSLKRYKELLYAAEMHASDENYAIVAAGHAAGDAIEFGGNDRVIMVGNVPLDYNAMAILRRSL